MNNIFYGCAPIVNGLFIMNLESENLIFNTDAKRLKQTDKTKYHIFVALSSWSYRKEMHEETP